MPVLNLKNSTFEEVWKAADERIKYFEDMYAVYEDWRLRGYVLKTGLNSEHILEFIYLEHPQFAKAMNGCTQNT